MLFAMGLGIGLGFGFLLAGVFEVPRLAYYSEQRRRRALYRSAGAGYSAGLADASGSSLLFPGGAAAAGGRDCGNCCKHSIAGAGPESYPCLRILFEFRTRLIQLQGFRL